MTPEEFRETAQAIVNEVRRVIVGLDDVIRHVIIALLSGGHVLLEGVPGIGKTMLVRTLSDALQLKFSRIQFTPDLMPADIIGTDILEETEDGHRTFRFQRGPIFANLVLADEINRATPKTQSALLEAMQEQTVTVADRSYRLELPFFVLATQNPIEMEGTYPLPEAQLDRFMFKVNVPFPSADELIEILGRTTRAETPKASPVADGAKLLEMAVLTREVPVASHVEEYAARLVVATHPESDAAPEPIRRYVRYGASPRGAQALLLGAKVSALLDGRHNVAFDDIHSVAKAALRHRLILNFEAQADGIEPDRLIEELLEEIPTLTA